MTKCCVCHSTEYRYCFGPATDRRAICEACFVLLPQKATWQRTLRAAGLCK